MRLIKALRRLASFEERGEGSFGAWLAQIVENRVRETVRHFAEADKRVAMLLRPDHVYGSALARMREALAK